MFLLIASFVLFIALSGVMAAIDAAVLSVTRPEVCEMISAGKWGARKLDELQRALGRAIVVIVILTNTINVLGPIIVSQLALAQFGAGAMAASTVALAFGTIVFSEIIPKALGARHAPLVSRVAAPFIRVVGFILYPLARTLEALTGLLQRGERLIGTEEQIKAMVTIGGQSGLIEGDEMRMIHRAFILNDRAAEDLMTPLEKVSYLHADQTLAEAAKQIQGGRYSRYPVAGDSIHDIQGIAMTRDILETLVRGSQDAPIRSISRPAFTVEKDRRSDWLLAMFRDNHNHLAIVKDQGQTVGVVSLEDVLEELVGEIEDERDYAQRFRKRI